MPQLRPVLPWLAWSAIAVPVGTILHELAHLAAYRLGGVPEAVLHFNTVSGASPHHPAGVLAFGALAGPIVTIALLGACCLAIRRQGALPVFAAAGLVTPFRIAVPAMWLVVHTIWGRANDANFDELNAARALGFPGQPLMLAEIAIVAAALVWLVRAIPRDARVSALLGTAAGGALGIATWWTLGPLLLP